MNPSRVALFEDVARTLVEAAGGVGAIFHTAGTLGRNGVRGWLLGELPEPLRVRGDKSPIRRYVLGAPPRARRARGGPKGLSAGGAGAWP